MTNIESLSLIKKNANQKDANNNVKKVALSIKPKKSVFKSCLPLLCAKSHKYYVLVVVFALKNVLSKH